MISLKQLEKDVRVIKERNARVKGNKAWETSYAMWGLLTLFTYLTIGI